MFSTRQFIRDEVTGTQHQIIRVLTIEVDLIPITYYRLDKTCPAKLEDSAHPLLGTRWRLASQLTAI